MDAYLALLGKDFGHQVAPDEIAALAEQAALQHVDGGMDLTNAVLKIVQGRALNPAHVARIVEGANTQAYLKLYDRCVGPTRFVAFEGGPARIFEVLEIVFGTQPDVKTAEYRRTPMSALDYRIPPQKPRQAFKTAAVSREDVIPGEMPIHKVAEMLGSGSATPGGQAYLYHTLRGAMQKVAVDISSIEFRMQKAAYDLTTAVEQAIQEGHTPGEVARVMLFGKEASEGKEAETVADVVRLVMQKIGVELNPESIPWGARPTDNHPLQVKTAELVELSLELEKKTAAHDSLSGEFNRIAALLRG